MRRKNILAYATILVMAALVFVLASCGGLSNVLNVEGLPDSYEGMTAESDLSAFALYREAYDNYVTDVNYKRTQFYDFKTLSGVANQDMQIKTVRKVNDGELYSEEVVLGAGLLTLNEGKKIYFKGGEAHSLYFNDKEKVPGTGEDVFAVKEWIDFGAYDAERYGDAVETERAYRAGMVVYDLSDASYLASDSSDTVYSNGDIYYFTLTVDCSAEALKGVQRTVAETIAKKTSGNPDDLSMLENTTIQAAVTYLDGKAKFKYVKITEKFKGKLAVFSADCSAMYFNEFEYGADVSRVTDAELGNLASA